MGLEALARFECEPHRPPKEWFDEVAIVPGELTINPELVELGLEVGGFKFPVPFMASAMERTNLSIISASPHG